MAFQRLQRDPGTPEEKCIDRLRAAPSVFWSRFLRSQLRTTHKGWVEEQLQGARKKRQDEWTGSIAAGSKAFIENGKAHLRFRAKGRDVIEAGEGYQLRENFSSYKALLGVENEDIDLKNTYFWDVKSE